MNKLNMCLDDVLAGSVSNGLLCYSVNIWRIDPDRVTSHMEASAQHSREWGVMITLPLEEHRRTACRRMLGRK